MEQPLVSVVIPVHNSARTLGECLESIRAQSYPRVELVVVDSDSQDNTCQIAVEYGARLLQMTGVPNQGRIHGMKSAEGDYIFLLDSDMVLSPDAVEACVKRLADRDIDALSVVDEPIATNYWSRCLAVGRWAYLEAGVYPPNFFPRTAVGKIDFEGDTFWGDDYVLYLQFRDAGFKIAPISGLIRHYEKTSLRSIVIRYYHAGKVVPHFARRHGVKHAVSAASPTLSSFFRRMICRGLLFKSPQYVLGNLFIKLLRGGVLVIGISVGLVKGRKNG